MFITLPLDPSPREGFTAGLTEINRLSQLPLNQRIYKILRGELQRGRSATGDIFPNEMEPINKFYLSRVSIRQVMDRLVSEGLFNRERGWGMFDTEPTLEENLSRIIRFSKDIRLRGPKAGTRALKIKLGDQVALIKRLRLANEELMCIEESHLNHKLCPGIMDHDFSTQPLHEILQVQYKLRITRALQKIHAVVATEQMERRLKTKTA